MQTYTNVRKSLLFILTKAASQLGFSSHVVHSFTGSPFHFVRSRKTDRLLEQALKIHKKNRQCNFVERQRFDRTKLSYGNSQSSSELRGQLAKASGPNSSKDDPLKQAPRCTLANICRLSRSNQAKEQSHEIGFAFKKRRRPLDVMGSFNSSKSRDHRRNELGKFKVMPHHKRCVVEVFSQ